MDQPKARSSDPPKAEVGRIHVFLSGRVQGVGMRATVLHLAGKESLSGWVRNLSDGRVELAAEGSMEGLKRFLQRMERLRYTYIDNLQVAWEAPTGEWDCFRITY